MWVIENLILSQESIGICNRPSIYLHDQTMLYNSLKRQKCEVKGQGSDLDADCSLQLQLEFLDVGYSERGDFLQLSNFLSHFIDGHLNGGQDFLPVVHNQHAFLHVGEGV